MQIVRYRFYQSKKTKKLYFVMTSGLINNKKEKIIIFADGLTGEAYTRTEEEFLDNFELYNG